MPCRDLLEDRYDAGQLLVSLSDGRARRPLLRDSFAEMLELDLELREAADGGFEPFDLLLERTADFEALAGDVALQFLESALQDRRQAIRQLACYVHHRLLVHLRAFLQFGLM